MMLSEPIIVSNRDGHAKARSNIMRNYKSINPRSWIILWDGNGFIIERTIHYYDRVGETVVFRGKQEDIDYARTVGELIDKVIPEKARTGDFNMPQISLDVIQDILRFVFSQPMLVPQALKSFQVNNKWTDAEQAALDYLTERRDKLCRKTHQVNNDSEHTITVT